MVIIEKLTKWIAQHKSLSIVGKRICCHPCNYFINTHQMSHVEQIIMRLFILNYINIFGAVASVGPGGHGSPDKVLAPTLVGLGRYIEHFQYKKFSNKNT